MFRFFLGFAFAALAATFSPDPPTLADDPAIQQVVAVMASMPLDIRSTDADAIGNLIRGL